MEEDNVDRISNLPEPIIHHILSFLGWRSVIQTSLFSRRWRYIWTSIPILKFHTFQFYCLNTGWDQQTARFIEIVDRVILQRDMSDIQRFDFTWDRVSKDTKKLRGHLNKWIRFALKRNLQELCIDIDTDDYIQFVLPQSLFNCKSLTKLELLLRDSEPIFILPKSMDLPRLKYLELVGLTFHDVELTSKLLSSCPVLESLIVRHCDITTDKHGNFTIYALQLRHFILVSGSYRPKCIKIYAPNLRSFICVDHMSQEYSLENLSSLVTADIKFVVKESGRFEKPKTYSKLPAEEKAVYAKRMMQFLRALHNVKELRLSPGFLELCKVLEQYISEAPDLLESRPPQFSNLRCLKLDMWLTRSWLRAIANFFEISPNIEVLYLTSTEPELADVGDDWETGLSLPCMLSHLKSVEIRGVEGCVNELKLLAFLLKKALVLEEVVLFSSNKKSPNRVRQMKKFSEKLRTFPKASSSITIMFFESTEADE